MRVYWVAAAQEGLQGGAAFNPGFMEVPSAFGQGTRIQPTMNGNMGSFGGGGMSALMERGRRDFVMPSPPAPTPKLDDGGSGGDIGKIIHNGELQQGERGRLDAFLAMGSRVPMWHILGFNTPLANRCRWRWWWW